ncbi:MAG: flippase-like domain-containing protein [Actinobacteria bacterium]|nr:MAG: flippase-like domain-containing protein [Actinomycetota bacterium]
MFHTTWHAISVFFGHLADVRWQWLAAAALCHFCKLIAVSTAWRNIVAAAYRHSEVRWRHMFGAYVAGTGVNAVIPARGGDAVKLFLAKRHVQGSTYTTLVSTVLLQTVFDMAVAGCLVIWAVTQGFLPGLHVLPHLPSLDYGWAFRHPRIGLILFVLLILFGGLLIVWIADRVEDFRARVAQGFSAFSDHPYYVTRVVPFQVLDWTLRLATVFCFLEAFQIHASLHNALLVQVSQSLATIFPFSPAGIGTEQALLLYIFNKAHAASRSALLSFSVGLRVTLIVVNATLGFTAILLMMRTLRFRDVIDADGTAQPERT